MVLVDLDETKLDQVVQQIKIETGSSLLAIAADITRYGTHHTKHFGKLDILVNNAGIVERNNVKTITSESFDRLIDVNVRSVFRLTQLTVPYLEETNTNTNENVNCVYFLFNLFVQQKPLHLK